METTTTITQWASETFGEATSVMRAVARVNEEMAELIRAITAGKPREKIIEEAADVSIISERVYSLTGVVRRRVNLFEHLVLSSSPIRVAILANSALSRFMLDFPSARYDETLCDLAEYLDILFRQLGTTRQQEVDKKMAINRQRVWKKDGTGHGYHVRDKSISDAHREETASGGSRKMKTMTLLAQLTCEESICGVNDDEQEAFFMHILGKELILHSNEIGEEVGVVKVLGRFGQLRS